MSFIDLRNEPDLTSVLMTFERMLKYKLNCVRIAIVDEYDAENRIAKVTIANKLVLEQTDNGAQVTQNYAPIYAKVLFFGWGDIGITHPVNQGMEGILLFNDREIESWYINGNINNLAYERAHSKTDAIFICGVLSLPNMITTLQDCLNLFYKQTYLKLKENGIEAKGNTTLTGDLIQTGNVSQTGNLTSSGTITGASLVDNSGATGAFTTVDGKTITVTNGIIKSIS